MTTQRATGKINITRHDSKPIEEGQGSPVSLVSITEDFTGEMEGTGIANHLIVTASDGCLHFSGMERFTGKLAGRSGSFVFQNSGELRDGVLQSEWIVIPGSGTQDFAGLSGTGGCRSAEGYFFDYWFE
ncbi:MAG TPA: DUF3224 domain-containing protein [Terracidiphilus sp.]|nr:DUF3224 domain-containing protein [Terracidiphilus sp.]